MSTKAYRVMIKMIESGCVTKHSNAYEAATVICIALKISVIQHADDMVLAQTARYMVKEELKDHDGDPYTATLRAIARIATKVVNDMENETFQLEG